eukprot:6492136-Amphidinium_carterae.3
MLTRARQRIVRDSDEVRPVLVFTDASSEGCAHLWGAVVLDVVMDHNSTIADAPSRGRADETARQLGSHVVDIPFIVQWLLQPCIYEGGCCLWAGFIAPG